MHCFVYKRCVLCFTFPAKSAILKTISDGYSYSAGYWQFQYGGTVYVSFMGKYGKTIACFRTPLSVVTAMIPEPRVFHGLEGKSVIRWIWEIPIWLDATVRDFKSMIKGPFLSG